MVIREDIEGSWLSAEIENSSNGQIAVQTTFSNQDISIRKSVFSYTKKKPTSKMLMEAVKALSNDERGASVPAIIKWISGNYAVSDMNRLKLQIKKAVMKALNEGTIVRSDTSKGSLGIGGSFVLGKETKKNRKKTKKEARNSL